MPTLEGACPGPLLLGRLSPQGPPVGYEGEPDLPLGWSLTSVSMVVWWRGKVGVFPLVKNKPEIMEKAKSIYERLKKRYNVFWDASGAIGRR